MKPFYLIMAVLGTVVPWIFFGQFIAAEGVDLPLFVSSLFANGAVGGFSADVLISAVVLWGWAYTDARERGITQWWVIVPATVFVGVSLAFPLYLWLRA